MRNYGEIVFTKQQQQQQQTNKTKQKGEGGGREDGLNNNWTGDGNGGCVVCAGELSRRTEYFIGF